MVLFEWNDNFSVGVAEFDDQHKQLIALLNAFSDALLDGRGNEALLRTVQGLLAYTQTHFTNEETKMTALGYPDYPKHKAEHDKLIAQVAELQDKVEWGTKPTVETMHFLKNWLINHIMKSDKAYRAFFNSKNLR